MRKVNSGPAISGEKPVISVSWMVDVSLGPVCTQFIIRQKQVIVALTGYGDVEP
ncbi:MAG TPA: hypothetical protein VLY63_13790 [Anaerolineae bacterium]|nr:hypothetical protein [Anaerolineae bacterium]